MNRGRFPIVRLLVDNIPLLTLIVIYAAFSLWTPRFLQLQTIENIGKQASYIGIIGVGVTFAIVAGGIDLSVGSIMYLSLAVATGIMGAVGMPDWIGVVLTLLAGVAAGGINGVAVVTLGLSPFVATLATMAIYRGVGLFLTKSTQMNIPHDWYGIGRGVVFDVVPVPVIIFVVVAIVAFVVMRQTAFGRHLYAVGINPEGAKKAGISVGRVRILAHVISGFCAALGGLVLFCQYGVVNANDGRGAEFNAIVVVVLGGVSLYGGRGSVLPGVLIGALLVQVVNAGLIFAKMNIYLQPIVFSLVIFAAVFLDSQRTRLLSMIKSAGRAAPASG